MVDADILGAVIEKFTSSDINLSPNPIYKDTEKTILKHPDLTITEWERFLRN